MKKKIIIITTILLIILLAFITIKKKGKSNSIDIENTNMIKLENNIQQEEHNIRDNIYNKAEKLQNSYENKTELENNVKYHDNMSKENSSLPSDIGLTVNGVPKTLNQDIMSKANIAYLLGCNNITDDTNLEEYINEHLPQNGIFISEQSIYKIDSNNPYDFLMKRKDFMKNMLSDIHFSYEIDKNNYLINNKGNTDLEQKLNKVINGNKKIIVGFVADYYSYINDIDEGIQLGGSFRKSYVSFKPFNNIYAFIFDENSAELDDFYEMIEEIANLAE